jgi:hypothetical protein
VIPASQSGGSAVRYNKDSANYFASHNCDDDMRRKASLGFAILCLTVSSNAFSQVDHARILGPQGVNLWKLDKHHRTAQNDYGAQDVLQKPSRVGKTPKSYDFPAQWFKQPLDHFDKDSKHSFHQRYWVSTRHYKPRKGAPVIVLDGGETSGEVMIYPKTLVYSAKGYTGSSPIPRYWNR